MAFNLDVSHHVHQARVNSLGIVQKRYPDATTSEQFQIAEALRKENEAKQYAKKFDYKYQFPKDAVEHPKVVEQKAAIGNVLAALLNKNPAP